ERLDVGPDSDQPEAATFERSGEGIAHAGEEFRVVGAELDPIDQQCRVNPGAERIEGVTAVDAARISGGAALGRMNPGCHTGADGHRSQGGVPTREDDLQLLQVAEEGRVYRQFIGELNGATALHRDG